MSGQEYPVTVEDEDSHDFSMPERKEGGTTVTAVLSYLVPAYVLTISISYLGVYPFAKFSRINPIIAASLLSSFVVFVVCLALHSYSSRESTRLASAISAGAMVVAYFTYLGSISVSRGLSIVPLPLFDLLCGNSHCSISLDLGQLGLITVAYLFKDRLARAISRAREP